MTAENMHNVELSPRRKERTISNLQRKAGRTRAMSSEAAAIDDDHTNSMMDEKKDSHRLSALVNWIQSLRVPFSKTDSNANGTPIISGLDRVLFGTLAASETVRLFGAQPPQYFWYMISGAMCDVLQFLIDYLIHFKIEDASACWAASFMLSIVARHTSHRYLVFGNYVGSYYQSLGRMYAGYSVIIVLSTVFNIFMTRVANLPHYVAWICTLLWTGIVNYFILKKLWTFGGKPPASSRNSSEGKAFITKESELEIPNGGSPSPSSRKRLGSNEK